VIIVLITGMMGACRAFAVPPPDTTLANQQWFENLRQPNGRHLPCCSIADCHVTASRVTANGYEVAIDDAWIAVPPERIVQQISNPTGRAVVCYRSVRDPEMRGEVDRTGVMIFCFVRPPES
jgi:hypothetical protein